MPRHGLTRKAPLLIVVASLVLGCSSPASNPEGLSGCDRQVGEYPPDSMTLVGSTRVEVPYSSWSCPGYHADNFLEPPSLEIGDDLKIAFEVPIEDGATIELNAVVDGERFPLSITDVGSQAVEVPAGAEEISIRVCTADLRCAMYVADLVPKTG